MWENLPVILLEDVFLYLRMRERYYCSQVCWNWYYVFLSPRLWQELTFKEDMFTYRRFSMYRGYQYELSHFRVQHCLSAIGAFLRRLTIKAMTNYHQLYEFMNVVASFLEFFPEYPMPLLARFEFTFGCESHGLMGSVVLGTGGKLLEELKRLLRNLKGLSELKMNQLLLANKEAIGILESTLQNSYETLTYLEILNCTKERYPLFNAGMFPHLRMLVITPPQINDAIVLLLAKHPEFKELVLVQDAYTPATVSLESETWIQVKLDRPDFRVRLQVQGITAKQVTVQECAPVHSIVYNTPYSLLDVETTLQIIDHYSKSLCVFGHLQLPRKHSSRSFHDRADMSYVMLIRDCPNIQVLVIRERISTATLIIVAAEAKNLQTLLVRRNAILKRFDWPKASHWSDEFYHRLKINSQSYDAVESEISDLLKIKWKMLTDKEFMKLKL